jgi:four helix bundle protein
MRLEDLTIHQQSIAFATRIYTIIRTWSFFDLETLGKQLIRAADAVPANLAEGYGRYSGAENRKFVMYARASLMEVSTHLDLAFHRKLLTDDEYESLKSEVSKLLPMIVKYGLSISKKYKI